MHLMRSILDGLLTFSIYFKQMKNNKADFRELVDSATTLLEILQTAAPTLTQGQPPDEFTKRCSKFNWSVYFYSFLLHQYVEL